MTTPTPGSARWRDQAACGQVGGDWWFPEPNENIPAPVLRICGHCPVRPACLKFALSTDELHGVWAALDPAELWELRERIAAGEPVPAVLADALAVGDQRRTATRPRRLGAAPWCPNTRDLDARIALVAERIATAADQDTQRGEDGAVAS